MDKLLDKFALLRCNVQDVSPQEVDWMWDVKTLKPFLDWFLEYPDVPNCISQRELDEYAAWCNDGKEMTGADLDKALLEYGVDVEKLSGMNFSQLELELADKEAEELKLQDEILSEVDNFLSEDFHKSVTLEQNLTKQLRSEQIACQKEGQNLMKINSALKSSLTDMVHSLAKLGFILKDSENADVTNSFLSNMPLDSFVYLCDRFKEYSNLLLKRNLEQASVSEKKVVAEIMSLLHQELSVESDLSSPSFDITNGLPHKMWKAMVSKISNHGTLIEYDAAIIHLENLMENVSYDKFNVLQVKMEVSQMLDDISRLSEDIKLLLKHEVASRVEEDVLYHITTVIEKITLARIERRRATLQKLCSVSQVMKKFLHLTDLVWMLLTLEGHRMKVATELFKEVNDLLDKKLQEHTSTMGLLHHINREHKECVSASSSGPHMLLGALQRLLLLNSIDEDSGNFSMSESIQCVNHLKEELESTIFMDVLESFKEQHSDLESSILKLGAELSKGATKKPCLTKVDMYLQIQDILKEFQKDKNKFEDLSNLFSVKQLAFKKYPVTRNRRHLWAWFLVAPEQLEEAIELAKKESKTKIDEL